MEGKDSMQDKMPKGRHPLAGGMRLARQRRARNLAGIQRRYEIVRRFLELVRAKEPAPQRTIARELGIHESRITRVLDAAYRDWRYLCADTVAQIVDASLAEFAWVTAEAQEQWERSKRDGESTVTEQVADVGADTPDPSTKARNAGKRVKVQKTVKAQCGDPRYLQAILDARDKVIRLTVGYQPTKVSGSLEVTDPRRALAELLGIAPERLPACADAPKERE
jgi:hypothetical protein